MSDPWALAEHDAGTCSPFTCPACEHKRAAAAGIIACTCGVDDERADCPDRHTLDDHCVSCMGDCSACAHRLDDGEA